MGYDEPWLRQSGEEVLEKMFDATRATNPLLDGHHAGAAPGGRDRAAAFSRRAPFPLPICASPRHRARWNCAARR